MGALGSLVMETGVGLITDNVGVGARIELAIGIEIQLGKLPYKPALHVHPVYP